MVNDERMLKNIGFLEAKHLKRTKCSSHLQDSHEFLGNVDQEHDVRMSIRYDPSDSVREDEAIEFGTPKNIVWKCLECNVPIKIAIDGRFPWRPKSRGPT